MPFYKEFYQKIGKNHNKNNVNGLLLIPPYKSTLSRLTRSPLDTSFLTFEPMTFVKY